jgi:hypothetical protein
MQVNLTHRFVRSSSLAAALSHALERHAGESSSCFDVEAVRVVFAAELFLIVSG